MAPLHRIIIDTDPGVDDILAILLALAASPEEIEVMLLSVTHGNVNVQRCLKNVLALFHVLEKELDWRRARGQLEGFDTMKAFKPIVAVGADHSLEDEILAADGFHGVDGLGGVHTSHPHLSPPDPWVTLFPQDGTKAAAEETTEARKPAFLPTPFIPSQAQAHMEILRLLRENPRDTITIVAIGPLTNLALAAAEDPETFLKVKEVVVMGGAIEVEGNITPVAEFNTYADAVATARVFALTSPKPASTLPRQSSLPPYPAKLSRRLNLTLFPLDITNLHLLTKSLFETKVERLVKAGSPLAEWTSVFMSRTFDKINSLRGEHGDPGLELHDPLCVWYMLTQSSWTPSSKLEDIRVETVGQWTRGMHVIERRNLRKADGGAELQGKSPGAVDTSNSLEKPVIGGDSVEHGEINDDRWLDLSKGNRVNRIESSPWEKDFARRLLERIFGSEHIDV